MLCVRTDKNEMYVMGLNNYNQLGVDKAEDVMHNLSIGALN